MAKWPETPKAYPGAPNAYPAAEAAFPATGAASFPTGVLPLSAPSSFEVEIIASRLEPLLAPSVFTVDIVASQGGVTPPTFHDEATDNSAAATDTRTPDGSALGIAAGDILLLHAYSRLAGTNSITPPASQGWTEITELTRIVSGAAEAVYWKRWGSGDTDDASPTVTLGTSGAGWAVTMTVWRGCVATGAPYSITPVQVARTGTPTLTSDVVATEPGVNTMTIWTYQSNDDNTLADNTRGSMPVSYNISNVASWALVYEQSVDSSVEVCSVTQTTQGTDNARVNTLVLEAE